MKIKHLLALFALLAIGSASAAPAYHVRVDTSAYSGSGWLDLQFNPAMDSMPGATATLSGFSGAVDSTLIPLVDGSVLGTLPGVVQFSTHRAFNALFQAIVLGGVFEFDLRFSDGGGELFSLALYGGDQVSALGAGDVFTNSLAVFALGGPATVFDPAMIEITVVPEPASLWLLVAGFALLAALRGHGVPTLRLRFILGTRLR